MCDVTGEGFARDIHAVERRFRQCPPAEQTARLVTAAVTNNNLITLIRSKTAIEPEMERQFAAIPKYLTETCLGHP